MRCPLISSGCLALACLVGSLELRAQTTDTRASLIARAQAWAPTDIAEMDLRRGPLAAAVMLIVRTYSTSNDNSTHVVSAFRRTSRLGLAAVLFCVASWGTYAALQAADVLNTPAGALLAGAVPALILLLAPLYLEHFARTWSRRLPIHA